LFAIATPIVLTTVPVRFQFDRPAMTVARSAFNAVVDDVSDVSPETKEMIVSRRQLLTPELSPLAPPCWAL
jgi:hypothetical protein